MNLKKELKLTDLLPKGLPFKAKKSKMAKARKRTMPKEIVGLKIDSTSITAAEVVNNGSKSVVKLARSPLPSGIIAGGEVRDPAALAEALGDFFTDHKLPRKGIRLGLGNSRIGVRMLEVPVAEDGEQLENAIRFRAHEMLSASVDEAVIDYHVLGTGHDENGEQVRRILLVVAYRESVDRYLAATDAANLSVVGIDLEAFALLRAATNPSDYDGGDSVRAVVSIDHERTTVAISDGLVCQFTRVLEWGDASIDSAVARGLRISTEEAAELRRELSSSGDDANAEQVAERARSLSEIVSYELNTLVRELHATIRFYQMQAGSVPVDGVLLSGSLADLDGFADELEGQLGMPLSVVDPFARVKVDGNINTPALPGEFTVAIGLGIED